MRSDRGAYQQESGSGVTRALVALFLVACNSPVSAPAAPLKCPVGQTRVTGTDGPHCIIPNEYVNAAPGCHPIACQAYFDWSLYGDGGDGAHGCAEACQAYCANDRDYENVGLASAADAGIVCTY